MPTVRPMDRVLTPLVVVLVVLLAVTIASSTIVTDGDLHPEPPGPVPTPSAAPTGFVIVPAEAGGPGAR